jgi:hypothetical protein
MSEHLDELLAKLQKPNSAYERDFDTTVTAAINELVRIVMNDPPNEREPGIPTRSEAILLFWLERCKSKHYVDKPLPDTADSALVVRQTASGREVDNYPSNPYTAPPFHMTVHMPDGSTEQWGPKRLRETGGMIRNSLPYDTRFGAELHYDPSQNKIYTVHGPNFNHAAYNDFLPSGR